MKLEPYGWSVGISDILQYRACPERFAFGMRRHLALPERLQLKPGERDEPPESTNWTNAYGSAIHEAINAVELGADRGDALSQAMAAYGTYLTPENVKLLQEDLDLYERRHPQDMELVSAERDIKVPLFVADDGQQVYFRFKLDVLFRSKQNRRVFLHRDYKSSAHRKTKQEVHEDPQMWSYNWAIHEYWPEAQVLFQEYDQLKFGVERTTKNAEQREQIKQWLISQVKIILADDVFAPKINQFCAWCPMVVTCRETRRATTYWRAKLAISAPLRKDGRRVRVEFIDDSDELERIIREDLPRMREVRKHLEHVEKELKSVIQSLSVEDRARLGWQLRDRKSKTVTPEGMRELHKLLGDSFYSLVSLSSSRLEEFVGKPNKGDPLPAALELLANWSVEEVSSTTLAAAK